MSATSPLPMASELARLTASDAFWWATGIEDTFITAPHPRTGRTLDEYELTQHYDRVEDDLALMADLGVPCARYGLPWHRLEPAKGQWDFGFADRSLERLLASNIEPMVDLVHYGLPPWIERAFLDPDYPRFVAEYAARVADRYRGRIRWYTPLNEPRITAWYCGRLGWWPPFARSWAGFVAVMLAVCRGIHATVRALQAVDREIVPYHVDATDLYASPDPTLIDEVRLRQQLVFLALDLISGGVTPSHPLWDWLIGHGASHADLDFFLSDPLPLPVIGINMYPVFTAKVLRRDVRGRLRITMPYASGDLISRLARLYHERYRAPLMISETASLGSIARRQTWLLDSVTAVRALRAEGVPVVGYTWWPMFALVTWAYRQGRRGVDRHVAQMGLWNLDDDPAGDLARLRTPLVDSYRALVVGGAGSVGALATPANLRRSDALNPSRH